MTVDRPLTRNGLTSSEISSGVVLGFEHTAPEPEPTGPDRRVPLEALEAAILPALLRGPCLLSFSGGMDSSFVLAVATRLARREGLPDPIPVTWRFTDAPLAEESQWQDDVCRSLDVRERLIWHAGDDLDLIGPIAGRLLRRHGVVHPANLHLHLPILEAATGGSLLTGFGGDQVLAGFGTPTKAWRRQVRRVPSRYRVHLRMRRGRDPFPWLHNEFSRAVQRQLLNERQSQPVVFADRVAWQLSRRDLISAEAHFAMVAADHQVMAVHPFLDPQFRRAIAGFNPTAGLAGRADLLEVLGDGILPPQAWVRRPKARFGEVFVRRTTREFIRHWAGGGIDGTFVDEAALRRYWGAPGATVGSAALLQHVWLDAFSRERLNS